MSPEGQGHRDRSPGPARYGLMRYASMGFELAAAIVGLSLLGLWVDYRFGTRPVGVLVGAGIGVIGGFYNFIRAALQLSRGTNAVRPPDETQSDHDHH